MTTSGTTTNAQRKALSLSAQRANISLLLIANRTTQSVITRKSDRIIGGITCKQNYFLARTAGGTKLVFLQKRADVNLAFQNKSIRVGMLQCTARAVIRMAQGQ